MRIALSLMMAATGLLAAGAIAQSAPPSPPLTGGGLMRADADHDGTITRAEMIADAEARFTAMDTNKDGKVTADERDAARAAMMAQWRGGGRGRGGADGSGGGGGMRGDPDRVDTRDDTMRRAGARFDRLDTNHDGRLDATEIAAARPVRARQRDMGDTAPIAAPAQ